MASEWRGRLAMATCVGLAACSAEPLPAEEAPSPTWTSVYDSDSLGSVPLAAWEAGDDVFIVGGGLGNGAASLVLRRHDGAWSRVEADGMDTLWWVFGQAPSDVWMVGERGRIFRWDGRVLADHSYATEATLFGVWAAAEGDAWAVGGSPGKGTAAPNDVVLHWDGTSWKPETLPGAARGEALLKVWGLSKDSVFAVGENGAVWHRRDGVWFDERAAVAAGETLTTVTGCSANEVLVAGGQTVVSSHDSTWTPISIPTTAHVVGAACKGLESDLLLVGTGSLKLFRSGEVWRDETFHEPYGDFHAAWLAPSGDAWIVGGDYFTPAENGQARRGAIAHYGSPTRALPPL